MRRTILILLLFALILPSVSAQDFNAFGDSSVNIVPCGNSAGNVTIQNTRDVQATYSLSVDGDASDFVTFSTISFTLNPKQSQLVNVFYNVPCTTRPGTYPVNINFNDGEIEKVISQEIIVAIPDNLNISATKTSAVIVPCGNALYTLSLNNPINFTEIYTISVSGHPNAHVSEKTAVLEGGERKDLIVTVSPDDCTSSGIFPLTVSIDTEKSLQHKETTLELIIKSTDIPLLAKGVSTIRTDYVDSTADLNIENTGDRETQYSLSIEGISWAAISPSSVTLAPGESKTLAFRLTPTKDIPTGRYPITLFATVEQTGIRYSKELTIKLQPKTFFERKPALVIAIAVIILAAIIGVFYLVRYLRSPAFKEKIRRWKEKREKARAAREKKRAELLKRRLEQQRKELERKQAERERIKKQMERKVEREFKKQYHVVARKDIIKGKHKIGALKIAALILGVLILLLIIEAWSVIAPNISYVVLGLILLGIIFIAKKLARNRVIQARWNLLLANNTVSIRAWKKGLSILDITSNDPVNKFRLLIRKIRARISPSPAVYQTFLLKTNAPDESVEFKATFTISKRWLARKHADFDDVKLARYSKQSWTTIPLKKTGEGKDVVHFTAELNKTGTYSLYARVSKQTTSPTRKLIWGIIGLAAIAAIAVILAPQPGTIAKGIPPQVWQQDLVHKIDLSKYFSDPDHDKLNYTATETKHITIDISGDTAFLTPETGWTGEERVRFIADDGKGGKVSSNTVPLRVKKNLVPAHIQPYIAILLAILAVILLIWTVRTQRKK